MPQRRDLRPSGADGTKKLLRTLTLAVLALVMVGGGAAHYFSRGMHRAADRFLAAVERDSLPDARVLLARSLRSASGDAWLKNLLAESDLYDARSGQWTTHRTAHGYGELNGSITRESGAIVPVTLLFVREELTWKLYAIRRPFTDALPAPIAPLLPGREERITLIKRAVGDFAASVRCRNMSYFRSTLAPSRRDLYTTEKLNVAFGHFFEIDEDLASLEQVEPSLQEMTRSSANGEVTLRGYFNTVPKQVHFLQKYAYEQTDWRLLSFRIHMK